MAALLIATTIICTVVGQVLVKMGVAELGSPASSDVSDIFMFAVQALLSWKVFVGFGLAFLGAVAWIFVLTKVPLGFAYPFMALAIVLVMLASGILFGEAIPTTRWIGASLVCVGLMVVAQG